MIPIGYVLKRIASYLITLLAAFTVIFLITHLAPGDPIGAILQQMSLRGQQIPDADKLVEAYREMFGLNGSLWDQYVSYITQALRGNLGLSLAFFPSPVMMLIKRALPWTIGLLSVTVILSWILGNLIGALIGWFKDSKVNSVIAGISLVLSRIPYYVLAVVLILVFASLIPIFPSTGAMSMGAVPSLSFSFIADLLYHATLPALSIILASLGGWVIGMRSLMINIQGEDYILFAEAKGLKPRTIMTRYAARNAMLPQVTGLALSLGYIVSGSLLTEAIFAYPGLGNLYITALGLNDYNLIQGMTLLIIFTVLTANLVIDLIYPLIDPRIRYGEK
ncbi:MAG: ABC transporter permease [Anaerolineae bacterium]|jgi:peptide/nickel transport system permease protein